MASSARIAVERRMSDLEEKLTRVRLWTAKISELIDGQLSEAVALYFSYFPDLDLPTPTPQA